MKINKARIFRKNEQKAIKIISHILLAEEVIENRGNFDWLRGDKGTKLRVDAYFPSEKLVLEYNGVQHFKPNKLMDRRQGRAEQRRRYTELRRKLIPKHGLNLLEINYNEPLTEEYLKTKLIEKGYKL